MNTDRSQSYASRVHFSLFLSHLSIFLFCPSDTRLCTCECTGICVYLMCILRVWLSLTNNGNRAGAPQAGKCFGLSRWKDRKVRPGNGRASRAKHEHIVLIVECRILSQRYISTTIRHNTQAICM